MKNFRKAIFIVLAIFLIIGMISCTKKVDPVVIVPGGNDLTPSSITQLDDLINYASKASYYEVPAATYADTTAESTKLNTRIEDKLNDENYEDSSAVVKIFANSQADAIIEAMRIAALPNAKMTLVVDYLAGAAKVDEADIIGRVDSGIWSATTGWSFFDDYDYYEKLQEEADLSTATDTDEDNVKRQYRNMAGKIFSIGMTGDEFARAFIREELYAVTVVEGPSMANALFNADTTSPETDLFWTYCKDDLDYDTLVSFLAFDDYYTEADGLAKSVQLYGYYYDYEKRMYEDTNDDEFEKGLKYGHQTTFTNAEWLEYVQIQRDSYEGGYRYSDNFYQSSFYPVHLSFQEKKEIRENTVYGIAKHNNMSYTEEMRSGMINGGFAGQLKMSDWLWCYAGDNEKMNAYNEANTKYETSKTQGAENAAEGEYYYNREQLKIAQYLLSSMTNTELGCALRYQIYNYSSDMVTGIQANKKDITLINVNKLAPEDYIYNNGYVAQGDLTGAKGYAEGKKEAIISQMASSLSTVGVKTKADKAASESWATMNQEIGTALDEANYASIATFVEKLDRQEDLVIKRKWSCGAEIGAKTSCTHGTCTKEYDTNHSISMFANNYATVLKHVSGQSVLTFKHLPAATYNLAGSGTDVTYAPSYYVANYNAPIPTTPTTPTTPSTPSTPSTPYEVLAESMLVSGNDYSEYEEITVESGMGFKEGIFEAAIDSDEQLSAGTKEGENWWNTKSKAPKTDPKDVMEDSNINNLPEYYDHDYTFIGWYLDDDLLYKLEDTDEINCDLVLYAGYSVKKN